MATDNTGQAPSPSKKKKQKKRNVPEGGVIKVLSRYQGPDAGAGRAGAGAGAGTGTGRDGVAREQNQPGLCLGQAGWPWTESSPTQIQFSSFMLAAIT